MLELLQRTFTDCAIPLTRHRGRARLSVLAHNGSPATRDQPPGDDAPPWLDVAVGSGLGRVGPFSSNGLSTCPGCVAAHERAGELIRPIPSTWVPDPVLGLVVSALAVRAVQHDLQLQPSLPEDWSCRGGVIEVDATGLGRFIALPRHPHCGCTWADFLML